MLNTYACLFLHVLIHCLISVLYYTHDNKRHHKLSKVEEQTPTLIGGPL